MNARRKGKMARDGFTHAAGEARTQIDVRGVNKSTAVKSRELLARKRERQIALVEVPGVCACLCDGCSGRVLIPRSFDELPICSESSANYHSARLGKLFSRA